MNRQVIGATNIDRVVAAHAREQLAALRKNVTPPRKTAEVVSGLERYFAAKPTDDLVECESCKGWSTDEVSACPYCGEAEIVERDLSTRVDDSPSQTLTVASAPEPSTRVDDSGLTSEPILDATIARFAAAYQSAVEHYAGYREAAAESCMLAMKLADQDWQQRTSDGKPKYKSVTQFIAAEIEPRFGIKRSSFYAMVSIARKGCAPDVALFGMKTAKILAAAPNDLRDELRDLAREGTPTREIEAAAHELQEHPPTTTNEPAAITIGVRQKTTEVTMTTLAPDAAVAVLPLTNGMTLQIALGRAPDGTLTLHVQTLGGHR